MFERARTVGSASGRDGGGALLREYSRLCEHHTVGGTQLLVDIAFACALSEGALVARAAREEVAVAQHH